MSDPFARVLFAVSTVLLIAVLGLLIIRDPNGTQAQLDRIEDKLNFNSCLILIDPDVPNDLAVAECAGDGN